MLIRQRDAVVGVLRAVVQLFPVVVAVQALQQGVDHSLGQHARHGRAAHGFQRLLPHGAAVWGFDHTADDPVNALYRRVPVRDPCVDDLAVPSLAAKVDRDFRTVLDAEQTVLIGVAQPVNGGKVLRKARLCL